MTTWSTSKRQSFRLFPDASDHLRLFLNSEGWTKEEILDDYNYHSNRAGGVTDAPSLRRYRDCLEVYQSMGLCYKESAGDQDVLRVTRLGHAVRRWIDELHQDNLRVLGRHLAYALSAFQLRNSIGKEHPEDVSFFPLSFLWRVMLNVDNRIDSDELNRAVLTTTDHSQLTDVIRSIRAYRATGNLEVMGDEATSVKKKNDRMIPWVAYASFGYTLLTDKREGNGYYRIRPQMVEVLDQASRITRRHREFSSPKEHALHISQSASLPPDLR